MSKRICLVLMVFSFFLTSCATLNQDPAEKLHQMKREGLVQADAIGCETISQYQNGLATHLRLRVLHSPGAEEALKWEALPFFQGQQTGLSLKMHQGEALPELEPVSSLLIKLNGEIETLLSQSPQLNHNPDLVEDIRIISGNCGNWILVDFSDPSGVYWFEDSEILQIMLPLPPARMQAFAVETIVLAENLDG